MKITNPILKATLILALIFSGISQLSAQGWYYRYTNEHGVKVINQSIPPEFAKNGYEIVTRHGDVVQVIPPAPKPEEVEAARAREFLTQKYIGLVKRYSSVEDIEAARERKFDQIDANIAIQKGNLTNINGQMDDLTAHAANFERSGRPVPARVLGDLDELKSQYASVEELIKKRNQEKEEIRKRFADDILLFEKGKSLLQKGAAIDREIIKAGLLEAQISKGKDQPEG